MKSNRRFDTRETNEGRKESAHDYYQINYLIIPEIKVCQLAKEMIEMRVNFFETTSTTF